MLHNEQLEKTGTEADLRKASEVKKQKTLSVRAAAKENNIHERTLW
jgi:hypothetical protein